MGAPVHDSHDADYKKARASHSAKLHFITFAVSMVLTVISFYIVMGVISPDEAALTSWTFAMPFISVLAVVQALFQLIFWMHMNEKGHLYPAMGIGLGFFVAITAVLATVYWMW
jgi:cytochrome c oxidase subunit 4